jgi:hypothetical protein
LQPCGIVAPDRSADERGMNAPGPGGCETPRFSSIMRPVQLVLLRRTPKPSTIDISGSRRYFIRSWPATVRPRVSGSAISSSATLIASNVIILSADPFGSQSPPLGNLGRASVFAYRSGPIVVAIWLLPLPGASPGGGRRLAANGVPWNEEAGARPAPFGYARRERGGAASWRRLRRLWPPCGFFFAMLPLKSRGCRG